MTHDQTPWEEVRDAIWAERDRLSAPDDWAAVTEILRAERDIQRGKVALAVAVKLGEQKRLDAFNRALKILQAIQEAPTEGIGPLLYAAGGGPERELTFAERLREAAAEPTSEELGAEAEAWAQRKIP